MRNNKLSNMFIYFKKNCKVYINAATKLSNIYGIFIRTNNF